MAEPRAIVPEKGIRPGRNSTGADLAKHVAVALDPAGGDDPPDIELPQGAGVKIYGVVVSSTVRANVSPDVGIPNGQIGDVQVEGRVPCLVGAGGVTIGDDLAVTVAGAVVTAAAGNIVVGKALTTAAAGEFTEMELVGAAQSIVTP